MAEAEVKTFWQRQRLAEAEVENPHVWVHLVLQMLRTKKNVPFGNKCLIP